MSRGTSHATGTNQVSDRAMEPEQFTQVIEAILAGKYSWACVLILRFAGYNPLHYIPYRTYNRLVKDNSMIKPFNKKTSQNIEQNQLRQENVNHSSSLNCQPALHAIKDLAYLEVAQESSSNMRGGWFSWFMN